MLHIQGLSLDGRLGQDVIQLSREVIGLALASEKYGAKYFANGAITSLILEHPGVMKPAAVENLRRSFIESQGGENVHRPMVLEQGVKATPIGNKPNESQMIETRLAQDLRIASIFHVPVHMIGIVQTTTRATAEQTGVEFVNYCLGPWLIAWQQEYRRKLLASPEKGRNAAKRYAAIFDTQNLTFPDGESRSKFYATGKQWGYLSTNDVRVMEGKNPVESPEADQYWRPVNMVNAEDQPEQPTQAPAPIGDTPGTAKPAESKSFQSHLVTFRDALGRYFTREKCNSAAFSRLFTPAVYAVASALLSDERSAEFVADYIARMEVRSSGWKQADVAVLAQAELDRVVNEVQSGK
jgi:hypothetical protein